MSEDKKKLYLFCIAAAKDDPKPVIEIGERKLYGNKLLAASIAVIVIANDKCDAKDKANAITAEKFPVTDRWKEHIISEPEDISELARLVT